VSLRLKLVVSLVALTTLATAAIGLFSYRATADRLDEQVDRSLDAAAARLLDRPGRLPPREALDDRRLVRGAGDVTVQVVGPRGAVVAGQGEPLPVEEVDRQLASSDRPTRVRRDVTAGDESFRMLTVGLGEGRGALQVARSLTETDQVLAGLQSRIAAAAVAVALAAGALGWLVTLQATRRLVRLTSAAEQVAATRQLDVEVPVSGTDETGRLGNAFNEMLAALARSTEEQRRLVQDAGHELRTPLTSLRTNVFTLRRSEQLSPDERARLLDDLESEAEELTRLIDEVLQLAVDERRDEPVEDLRLGEVVARVAERAAQRSGRRIDVTVDDTVVSGQPLALERAVGNLVENALKFDPAGPVEVSCSGGTVEVADRGPGIAPEDLSHVFDRFYRADAARSRPGSGLGLAIVADIVGRHGGQVHARQRDGGGAVVGFTLPQHDRGVLTEPSP
jgi:two-component system sensor histidine kinase MprB